MDGMGDVPCHRKRPGHVNADEQIDNDAKLGQPLRRIESVAAAGGMTDQDDWLVKASRRVLSREMRPEPDVPHAAQVLGPKAESAESRAQAAEAVAEQHAGAAE